VGSAEEPEASSNPKLYDEIRLTAWKECPQAKVQGLEPSMIWV
jgi:hypothetical protein